MALKRLRPKTDAQKDFENERAALEAILDFRHDHLIQVIASIKKGHNYYFLFPWADGGNLRELWKVRGSDPRSEALVRWCLEQMKGIANGLRKLHRPSQQPKAHENWRHGDLRPENIVFFINVPGSQFGRLCITDVGLARFHKHTTQERKYGSATPSGFRDYAPPEGIGTERSRSYDMWSLGCIYLEFLIWLMAGLKGLNDFNKTRSKTYHEFFLPNGNRDPSKLHPVVEDHIKYVTYDERYKKDTMFYDLLKLVRDHLLRLRESKRYKADELDDYLGKMAKNAKDKSYLLGKHATTGQFMPSDLPQKKKTGWGL
jgi:serine/threonine protein kinase